MCSPCPVVGFLTAVVLIPDKHAGFSTEINSEDGEIIRGLMCELLDHYLGLPRTDWTARFKAQKRRKVGEALAATIEPAYVTFGLNCDGRVDRVTLKAVSPLADFSYDYQDLLFTPVAGFK